MLASKRLAPALGLALLFLGCERLGIFQDIGTDPHPPTLTLIRVEIQPPPPEPVVEPTPEPLPPEPEGEPSPSTFIAPAQARRTFDTGGLTVNPDNLKANMLRLTVAFTDLGGDVVRFKIRDRDGSLSMESVPIIPEESSTGTSKYFPGLSGTLVIEDIVIDMRSMGPHRLEIWAEDSHDSRSDKTEFIVTIDY